MFLQLLCLKKGIISLAVIAVHGIYKQLHLLRVEAKKWPKIKQLLRTIEAETIPRLKQLKLKLAAQKATLLVDEY